jgi:hypothetical protein
MREAVILTGATVPKAGGRGEKCANYSEEKQWQVALPGYGDKQRIYWL